MVTGHEAILARVNKAGHNERRGSLTVGPVTKLASDSSVALFAVKVAAEGNIAPAAPSEIDEKMARLMHRRGRVT
jgi:hypothetical protein